MPFCFEQVPGNQPLEGKVGHTPEIREMYDRRLQFARLSREQANDPRGQGPGLSSPDLGGLALLVHRLAE